MESSRVDSQSICNFEEIFSKSKKRLDFENEEFSENEISKLFYAILRLIFKSQNF